MRVELRGVGKRFGRTVALDGVDLALSGGSRTALIGPNGSGKSTLTRILLGLLAHEGEALVDGRSPRDTDVRARMAYIPQIAPRMQAPVGELVDAVCALRGLRPDAVAAEAERLALPLRNIADRHLPALSGGMRQKLLIALALATPAGLLILDEPTASLDADARDRFFARFHEIPQEVTVLLCSHRLEELRNLVDRIAVLQEGRLDFEGSAGEFLDRRTRSVVEVVSADAGIGAALEEAGFSAVGRGRWRRTVGRDQKRDLVLRLARDFGDGIEDLQIREMERVELAADGGEGKS